MLILTEKPSVAKDFAMALGCKSRDGFYSSDAAEITYCVGHLFRLQNPEFYDAKFRSWKEIPIIPYEFCYMEKEGTEKQAALVMDMMKRHRHDMILIATDADREGEIIARECLLKSGITDFSRIRRFWVSQALTSSVIREGIKSARPLCEYDALAKSGFARQHSDWLVGINFTRYITTSANRKLTIGRVQTSILSAIDLRCEKINNFRSERYFEHHADFSAEGNDGNFHSFKGFFFEGENRTMFPDNSRVAFLHEDVGKKISLVEENSERKETPPPQLYSLNAIQKDAFKLYGFSADKTLGVIQNLYEKHKCVSYPRTPSRVMGSGNVELCRNIWGNLFSGRTDIARISDITSANKRVFDDTKLDAHHALIPLKEIPEPASDEERKIYEMVLSRFKLAFASPYVYERRTAVLSVGGHKYKVVGKKTVDEGWKKFECDVPELDSNSDGIETQDLDNIDWTSVQISRVETREKWTKPPRYFNEASLLAFMENPKGEEENFTKLVGLGTAATRHTFVPKLKSCGYIEIHKKGILTTPLGKALLNAVRVSPIKSVADVSETTKWEKSLDENPDAFERKIREFVTESVSKKIVVKTFPNEGGTPCPKCGKSILKGNRNWYCSDCGFKIWDTVAGTRLSEKDVDALCSGKRTSSKKFTSKGGKEFKAKLFLDGSLDVKFDFGNK